MEGNRRQEGGNLLLLDLSSCPHPAPRGVKIDRTARRIRNEACALLLRQIADLHDITVGRRLVDQCLQRGEAAGKAHAAASPPQREWQW